MGTDSLSTVNLSGDEHSVGSASGTKPKIAPRNEFLSTLNKEFEKSKAELLGRFLVDQAELNRRFGESSDADREDSESGTRDESSLKETENLLRQRLSLHRQGLSRDRARTSMGFYHRAEFKGADNDSDCSSDADSTEMSHALHVQDTYQGCKDVLRQLGVSCHNGSTLQTCVRPKTSVANKSITTPPNNAQGIRYSRESVPTQRTQMHLSRSQMALAIKEYQPCFAVDGKDWQCDGRPFRRHSEFSLSLTKESSNSKLLRPMKWSPALVGQNGDNGVPLFCRNKKEVSVGLPIPDSDLQVFVPQTSRARIYKPHSFISKNPVSFKVKESFGPSISKEQFVKSRRCHAQIRKLNMQSNFPNKNGYLKTSYHRSQPLTLVKLPPLQHTGTKSSSGHSTLNPACF